MYKYTKTEFTEASGAGAMNGTLDNTISSEQGSPDNPLVRIASTGHGIIADSRIMLPDVATYPGLRNIEAVAANSFDISNPDAYADVTPAGTELWYVGYTSKNPWTTPSPSSSISTLTSMDLACSDIVVRGAFPSTIHLSLLFAKFCGFENCIFIISPAISVCGMQLNT